MFKEWKAILKNLIFIIVMIGFLSFQLYTTLYFLSSMMGSKCRKYRSYLW